jgi:hypothetical protein
MLTKRNMENNQKSALYYGMSSKRLTSAVPSDFRRNCFNGYLAFGEIGSFALNIFLETIDPTLENVLKNCWGHPLKFSPDPMKQVLCRVEFKA